MKAQILGCYLATTVIDLTIVHLSLSKKTKRAGVLKTLFLEGWLTISIKFTIFIQAVMLTLYLVSMNLGRRLAIPVREIWISCCKGKQDIARFISLGNI